MKKRLSEHGRKLAIIAVLAPLSALFIYVALRSGPLAPVPVTVATVETRSITPALFGVGTVEARYTYRIGPTVAGRVKRVDVHVGESVRSGQLLGEMDPVDLDERVVGQEAALKRAEAAVLAAEAQVRDNSARLSYADAQAKRYEKLLLTGAISQSAFDANRQELQVAEAGLASAQANLNAALQEKARISSERGGIAKQRANLRLVAPVDGLVSAREADPGTTLVAGQSVIEIIDPKSLWINTRFNQLASSGLRAELPATIVLRSESGHGAAGQVLRVEPLADAVTEETLARVVFDSPPAPLPPVGELAEVTVALPALPDAIVLPNASLKRVNGQTGVWVIDDGKPRFVPVRAGSTDLDGRVQVLEGLKAGERVVVYSQRAINDRSRVKIVERLPGVPQ